MREDAPIRAQLYEGIISPAALDDALQRIDAAAGGGGAVLFWQDRRTGAFLHFRQAHTVPGLLDDYRSRWAPQDPWAARAVPWLKAGMVAAGEDLIATEQLRRTAFHHDFMRPLGWQQIDTVAIANDGEAVAALSLHRFAGAGPVPPRLALLRRLAPDLVRAFAIERALRAARAEAGELAMALDQLPYGLLALDRAGRLVHANARARAQLDNGQILCLRAGRIAVRQAGAQSDLEAAIARALAGASSALRLAGPAEDESWTLHLHPVKGGGAWQADFRTAVLLWTVDPAARASPQSRLRQLFGLTAREAALAALLIAGRDLAGAAEELALAKETARFHLKSLFAKTGTNRQGALIVRLLCAAQPGGFGAPGPAPAAEGAQVV